MYSGGDSNKDAMNINKFNQFHVTPTHSQPKPGTSGNLLNTASASTIDWASLAQQWIQMRDTNPNTSINMNLSVPFTMTMISSASPQPHNIRGLNIIQNENPPPNLESNLFGHTPKININYSYPIKSKFDEKGEADMDMDDDYVDTKSDVSLSTVSSKHSTKEILSASSQQNWFEYTLPYPNKTEFGHVHTSLQEANCAWNLMNEQRLTVSPSRPSNEPSINSLPSLSNSTAHIPALMKLSVPNPNMKSITNSNRNENSTNSTGVDASKRRILPAWIREGLEKMEREKHKNVKNELDTKQILIHKGEKIKNKVDMVKDTNVFEMDCDNSGNEDEDCQKKCTDICKQKAVSKNIEEDGPDCDVPKKFHNDRKTYEQKIFDLMILVRKTLTELLLEVTNDEISLIANDTIKSRKIKAPSVQVIPQSSFSTITNKLGLTVYAGSSSDDDPEIDNESNNGNDEISFDGSEEEIKTIIRQKHRNFVKIAENIEDLINETTGREGLKLKYYSQLEEQRDQPKYDNKCGNDTSSYNISYDLYNKDTKLYDGNSGEPTDSKYLHNHGNKGSQRERSCPSMIPRKERTTRFSDNKDVKSVAAAVAVNYISTQIQQHHNSCTQIIPIKVLTGSNKISENSELNFNTAEKPSQTLINEYKKTSNKPKDMNKNKNCEHSYRCHSNSKKRPKALSPSNYEGGIHKYNRDVSKDNYNDDFDRKAVSADYRHRKHTNNSDDESSSTTSTTYCMSLTNSTDSRTSIISNSTAYSRRLSKYDSDNYNHKDKKPKYDHLQISKKRQTFSSSNSKNRRHHCSKAYSHKRKNSPKSISWPKHEKRNSVSSSRRTRSRSKTYCSSSSYTSPCKHNDR